MGLSQEEQQNAHLAGLVHDIGKVGLPPGLLEKEGPLTLEERRIMQTHSEIGERIWQMWMTTPQLPTSYATMSVLTETGTRTECPGDEIPLIARIIGVADAYNAMTSDRPYREAMPSQVARLRLAQAVGSQFDVSVVAALKRFWLQRMRISHGAPGRLGYRVRPSSVPW